MLLNNKFRRLRTLSMIGLCVILAASSSQSIAHAQGLIGVSIHKNEDDSIVGIHFYNFRSSNPARPQTPTVPVVDGLTTEGIKQTVRLELYETLKDALETELEAERLKKLDWICLSDIDFSEADARQLCSYNPASLLILHRNKFSAQPLMYVLDKVESVLCVQSRIVVQEELKAETAEEKTDK